MKNRFVRAFPLLFLAVLSIHFAATLVYLMPANPVKLRLLPVVSRYIEPFFTQKWELFAPDPLVDTRLLLVSCRLDDGSETEWSDMTTPLREAYYHNRLSPSARIDRAQQSSIHLIYRPDDPLFARLLRLKEDTAEYRELAAQYGQERLQLATRGKRVLSRTGAVECDRLYGTGRTQAVRVRMVQIKAPPFSKRQLTNAAGETKYVDFEWAPYESVSSI
jgi:hypothetical protein